MSTQPCAARRVSAAGVAASLLAAIIAMLLPASVTAARPLTFSIAMDDKCVEGRAPNKARVSVVWKDSDGRLKQKGTTRANDSGYWMHCGDSVERIERGDVIRAALAGSSRTVTMPLMRMVIDRVSDEVIGKGPPSTDLTLGACVAPGFDDCTWYYTDLGTDGGGSFDRDFTAVVDLRGGDFVRLYIRTPIGDVFMLYQAVPFIEMTRGKPWFSGVFRPNRNLDVALFGPGPVTRDEAVARTSGTNGSFWGRFADADGDPIRVRAGDRVQVPQFGADADWIVPSVSASATRAGDVVSGTCIPNGYYGIFAQSPRRTREAYLVGKANASGSFSRDLTSRIDLRTGYIVTVDCRLHSGDIVSRRVIVP